MRTVGLIPMPPTEPGSEFVMDFPKDGKVLDVMVLMQPGGIMTPNGPSETQIGISLVVLADAEALPVPRKFCFVNGGMQLPDEAKHCKSFMIQQNDFHIFELECPQVVLAGD